MRIVLALAFSAAWAAALPGAAQAAPLASATLTVGTFAGPTTFPGIGAAGTATSPLSATLAAGSAFAGSDFATLTPGAAANSPTDKILVVIGANAAGSLTGATPGLVGGSALFTGIGTLYDTASPGDSFLQVPIRIGRATSFTVMGAGLAFSVYGAPWTAGAATVTGLTGSMTTLMATGMNALDPFGVGTLTLVAPSKVRISTGNRMPTVSTLVLTYVPEPGTGALLAAGTLGSALLARRRRRR
jgi:hypothetical protein